MGERSMRMRFFGALSGVALITAACGDPSASDEALVSATGEQVEAAPAKAPLIQLELTLDEVNHILDALGEREFAEVYELITKIQQQAQSQLGTLDE